MKIVIRVILSSLTLVSAVYALPACAQTDTASPSPDGQDRLEKLFQGMDINRDGLITDFECVATARQKFGGMDVNQDGKIPLEEYRAFWNVTGDDPANAEKRRLADKAFHQDDTDSDTIITMYENMTNARNAFKVRDTDHDNYVTMDEFRAYANKKK